MERKSAEKDQAHHLCVVIHGLWGSTNHVKVMADMLREKHADDRSLHILVSKSNCRSLTYDGIEVGGQRLCMEILDEVENLARREWKVTRISMAVYSYGGLIARYAIGLLESQGFFHNVKPINFSAFASPFLGARSPIRGWRGDVMNTLFPYVFCGTGREFFLIDNFRGSGRPLLDILADPKTTFMKGLARFQRRSLYGNIINDISVAYYTSTISTTDPYANPSSKAINYLSGYENVIVDIHRPVTLRRMDYSRFSSRLYYIVKKIPTIIYESLFLLGMTVFVPLFCSLLFLTYIVQSVLSPRRIYWHQKRLAGIRGKDYTLPLIFATLEKDRVHRAIGNMQEAAESIYEVINHTENSQRLIDDGGDISVVYKDEANFTASEWEALITQKDYSQNSKVFATLALDDRQLAMASALNNLGWRKYPVHIHKVKRAHAALIMRINSSSFDEGKIVLRHWVEEEFIH